MPGQLTVSPGPGSRGGRHVLSGEGSVWSSPCTQTLSAPPAFIAGASTLGKGDLFQQPRSGAYQELSKCQAPGEV